MRRALDELVIEGIKTTIPLHRRIFRNPDFIEGTRQHDLGRARADAAEESAEPMRTESWRSCRESDFRQAGVPRGCMSQTGGEQRTPWVR